MMTLQGLSCSERAVCYSIVHPHPKQIESITIAFRWCRSSLDDEARHQDLSLRTTPHAMMDHPKRELRVNLVINVDAPT